MFDDSEHGFDRLNGFFVFFESTISHVGYKYVNSCDNY